MQIVLQILSCFKISNIILLALQCSNALVSLSTHYSNRVFTISQKYVFYVNQSTTSAGKFNIFFLQEHGQKVPLRMHQNTPFQMKNWVGRGTPPHTLPLAPSKPSGSTLPSPRISARFATLGSPYDAVYVILRLAVSVRLPNCDKQTDR